MRRLAIGIGLCVIALLLAGSASAVEARRETVLFWDDWESYTLDPFVGLVGERVCVFFQAPPWARSVAGLQVFISNDGIPAEPPDIWTTEPFLAYVWRVTPGEPRPSLAVCYGANSGSDYVEDELLELRFPEPVSIEDYAVFPDKHFFVGLEWLHESNPIVLAAAPGPLVYKTWEYRSGHWDICLDRNVMLRAIVTDAAGTPVEGVTWARVKAMFR